MKKILTLFIITTVFSSVAVLSSFGQVEKNLLERTWIAVESKEEGSNERFWREGFIFNLKDGKGEIIFIGSDSTQSFNYRMDDNLILKNNTVEFGKIRHLSQDSMSVLVEENVVTLFLPTKEYHPKTSIEELNSLLTSNAWNEISRGEKNRIDFFDKRWEWMAENDHGKICILHYKSKNWYYRETERWIVFEYKGQYFLDVSIDQMRGVNVYHIREVDGNRIEAEVFNFLGSYPVTFEAIG